MGDDDRGFPQKPPGPHHSPREEEPGSRSPPGKSFKEKKGPCHGPYRGGKAAAPGFGGPFFSPIDHPRVLPWGGGAVVSPNFQRVGGPLMMGKSPNIFFPAAFDAKKAPDGAHH